MYILYLILFIIAVLFFKCVQMKLSIDWKTFYRRGFQKIDNNYGIICYTGKQGYGKTYSAVKYIMDLLVHTDYIVLTNIKSFSKFRNTFVYIDNLYDLIDYCKGITDNEVLEKPIVILFDEIFSLINKNYSVDDEIMTFISQLRKRHIILVTTAQEWSEINISFRKYVRFQVSCRMFAAPFSRTAFLLNHVNDGENLKLNVQTMEYEAPTVRTKFFKGNKVVAEAYDTYETIHVSRKSNKKNKYINYVGDVPKIS